jgi:hypothetical protein
VSDALLGRALPDVNKCWRLPFPMRDGKLKYQPMLKGLDKNMNSGPDAWNERPSPMFLT